MSALESREILGIVYCPVCECDTMPSERTGECFWCETLLTLATPGVDYEASTLEGRCRYCDGPIPEKRMRFKAEFCCDTHRKDWWHRYAPKSV